MTKPWQYQTTQDKLKIFISSRLLECKEERTVVQSAIHSLNHQPVLFEHLGARTYSPRNLYLSRLSDSQAMVAIYRLGYGYIDQHNDMEISGLEDEYQFAKREGIDTLYYVLRQADEREQKLQSLIDEISTGPTISFYDIPAQLYERIRDDITALITEKYLTASSHSGVMQENPTVVLRRTLASVGVVISRDGLIKRLTEQIAESLILCIYGVAGIGKTTISAQLAQGIDAKFVRASGLTPKEVFAVCADLLMGLPATKATPFTTLEGARLSLAAAWAEIPSVTLILDECDFIPEVLDALVAGGGATNLKRIIYTSREPSKIYTSAEIPPFTDSEIAEFITKSPRKSQSVNVQAAGGNPLLLQLILMRSEGSLSSEYIKNGGSFGEILTYLALSPIPLSAEQLIALRADDSYDMESLSADIHRLSTIVDDSPRGYRLLNSDISIIITSQIKESHQRYKFYVNRLIRQYEDYGYYRHAYELAATLEDGSEERYLKRAIREAAQLGDWRLGVALTDQLLSKALDTESKSEALHLMLTLIYPLELMGDVERASELLSRARTLANLLGGDALLNLEEVEISSKARRAMLTSDVDDLIRIYKRYDEQGRHWDKARLGLELSAIYLNAKNFEDAIEILRPTLSMFEELGDEYGVDLAQRNLASTLSAIPGNEEEADRLITQISARAGEGQDTRRQRAWLCNILTRRLRSSGRYEEAEAVSKEAIQIATELGDESLRALNLVNLGNVYRGRHDPVAAIAAYENAAVIGKKCGRRDIEADASRLVAGIYNDFEEMGESQARREKAKFYAQHAVGLVRNSVNHEAMVNASWELAEALEKLGDLAEAAKVMFSAAAELRKLPDQDDYSRALSYAAELSSADHVEIYLSGLADVLGVENPNPKLALADRFLELVVPIIEMSPKKSLIHLLGGHLGEIRLHLPPLMRRGLASAVVESFHGVTLKSRGQVDTWRVLYSAIVVAALFKDTKQVYFHHKIATSIASCIHDVFVREEGDGTRVWTLILKVGRRVTVTIACLDASPASNLAALALTMFMKAFEVELYKEIIGSEAAIDELMIHIGEFSEMPKDLQEVASQNLGLDKVLTEQPCSVSRPTDFMEASPTCVFLGRNFLRDVSFGKESGHALELLFGLTLVEVAFQMLRGEVAIDAIEPKVISLVRSARP